jgi:hypothetical protein
MVLSRFGGVCSMCTVSLLFIGILALGRPVNGEDDDRGLVSYQYHTIPNHQTNNVGSGPTCNLLPCHIAHCREHIYMALVRIGVSLEFRGVLCIRHDARRARLLLSCLGLARTRKHSN